MPRKMQNGLMDLLSRKDKQVESHSTLKITIDSVTVDRTYYFATAELDFENVTWRPLLKRGDQIRASLTRAADQATCEIHNVDTLIGVEFLKLGSAIYGAEIQLGRYWLDLLSGTQYHKVLLTGPIVGMEVAEDAVRLTAVSEAYANVNVGASRAVTPICQWVYKDVSTCQYAGPQTDCNLLLNHVDGCEGRHGGGVGATLKRAKYGGDPFLNSQSRLKTE